MTHSIRTIALHEAGHCICNWVLGHRVDVLEAKPDGGNCESWVPSDLPDIDRAITGLCGSEACRQQLGTSSTLSESDAEAFRRLSAAEQRFAQDRATWICDAYSVEILVVAEELLNRQVLLDADLAQLCRENRILQQFAGLYDGPLPNQAQPRQSASPGHMAMPSTDGAVLTGRNLWQHPTLQALASRSLASGRPVIFG